MQFQYRILLETFVLNYLNLDQWFRRCFKKVFLFLDLEAILFSAAK